MKKIIIFILILIPWFLSGFIFKSDPTFYYSLNLPRFAPPPIVFAIVWPILYVLISFSILLVVKEYKLKEQKDYSMYLIINYIANQLFTFFFFKMQNLFLGFVDSIIILLTSLFLYYETKSLNIKSSKFLISYVIWNLFATVLSITIYFMNF